jgi:hypothetical protein
MNVNLYLPDDLGEKAKAAELPLSRLLQVAVRDELDRRNAVSKTLDRPETYELDLEDRDGNHYIGRITGKLIADDDRNQVYLTDDERVIVHDTHRMGYWEVEYPEQELSELSTAAYTAAAEALGIKPVIDL